LESRANGLFIECCQQAIIGREVILLFDTFERVQQRHVGEWLLREFLPQVRSLIVVVAGRPVPSLAQVPDNVVAYNLKGFNLEEAREYVQRRWLSASEEIIRIVRERTDGAPLIMDLIFDLPLPGRDDFIAELGKLKDGMRVQDSSHLQRWLVGQFSRPSRINRVIWAMAYLWRRFDSNMLKYVIEEGNWFPPGDYTDILEELKQSIYIKEYPHEQSHLLHDEIRRIVADYVLAEVADPWEEMRDPLYGLIVDRYYLEVIDKAKLENKPELAHQLQAERSGYILDREPNVGLEQYEAHRREIEDSREYDFEELLWGEVREHLDAFEEHEQYETCWNRGLWLQKHSLFYKAEEHYRQMLTQFGEQQVETSQALGFVLMRQGKISEAETVFEESLASVTEGDSETLAMIENNLGQAARVAGKWDESLEHYARSFRAATLAHNPARMVSVYVNRGYLYSLQGLYANAQQQCENAIALLESLPSNQENIQRAIYAWMNLGTAFRHSGDFATAAQDYGRSLELAEKNKNREATCYALQHLGINELLRGRMLRRQSRELATACRYQLQAWQYLTRALEIARESGWRTAIADGLNRLAKMYREVHRLRNLPVDQIETPDVAAAWQELQQAAKTFEMPFEVRYEYDLLSDGQFAELGWLAKAARLFEVSALIADEVNNFHRALESLTEVARTLEELGLEERVSIVLRRIGRLKGYDYQEELFAAMSQIIQGDLDFKQGAFDKALEGYKRGYSEIAKLSGYAAYVFADRLRDLEWRMREMPPEIALKWCVALEEEWFKELLVSKKPAMLDLLERIHSEILGIVDGIQG